jgi:PucR family transcriptional regulator, purine catabolism regulatory protein
VRKYLEHFPKAVLQESDRVSLPLLEIPWEVPFGRVTEEINGAVIAEQYGVIEQGGAIHQALTHAAQEAESLQDIAATLSELVGRAVTFEDPDATCWAPGSLTTTWTPARRATIEQGRQPVEVEETLSRLGYTQAIRDSAARFGCRRCPRSGCAAGSHVRSG